MIGITTEIVVVPLIPDVRLFSRTVPIFMAELKTFLFTDIVGSVDLKGEMPGRSDAERDQAFIEIVLKPHRERIEERLQSLGGRVVSTAGDGNFLVFSDTIQAARWAVAIQQSHRDQPIRTPRGIAVNVRTSMHLGLPQIDPHDSHNFIGKPVDYAARLCDYATGGQILVSRSVVAVLEDAGMDGITFHSHGARELKGIGRVEVFELVYDPAGPRTMRAKPRESPRDWTVLPATMGLTEFHARHGQRLTPSSPKSAQMGEPDAPPRETQSPPVATDVVPLRLGNYELENRLGSGGMGDVYLARHTQFGRVRAVKVIKQHFVDVGHREVIRRFYQEIKAVGALEHPNIVVAIDSSAPSDAIHYLVMEYIDGIGADQLVARRGPIPVAEACEIARQAARGLAYIHQHGMVHRDVKPSNLMLTIVRSDGLDAGSTSTSTGDLGDEQPLVKILDLGLALLVGDDQQRLTQFDDRAMGTAMYMSPEQWKTTSVDIRADIYSLGCTLYHLLAGKPPFWKSDLRPEIAHEREALPPIHCQSIPPELWDVLERMTAKDRDDRFRSPAEVIAALTPLAEGHQLVRLIKLATGTEHNPPTTPLAKADTQIAKSTPSDTRLGRAPTSWGLAKSLPPQARHAARRVVGWTALLAAATAVSWLVLQATGRHESLDDSRQRLLQVAADSASKQIGAEIEHRFRMLQRLGEDDDVQRALVEINSTPDPAARERLWQPLQYRLGDEKQEGDQQAAAESWFISDRHGTQIARSPRGDSLGHNYAYRDYFHGRGSDLAKRADENAEQLNDVLPITSPHLSAVYESTSDGTLRVAFSIPVTNGRSGADRQVEGVLAMSVDLGEFNVLENVLDRDHGQEVVLVDMEEDYLDGVPRRGLILHHNRSDSFGKDAPPRRLDSKLLGRISQILAQRDDVRRAKPARQTPATALNLIADYADPLSPESARKYWGAIEPVVVNLPGGTSFDTGWVVIVQEPMTR